jgi:glycosyltransferase involved in cell wall biosynthesis
LIISPHFPPVNAPDMQRIRISLPYYKAMGWEPVVLCVDEKYVSGYRDELLNETIPPDIEIHRVKAFSEKLTRPLGIRSLSLRSYYQFKKKGTELLRKNQFDLIFFSTSLFHVCQLGPYWKKKFGVNFVIDMQDPWRNDFFNHQGPVKKNRKFWINHTINKTMEKNTMPHASGIMSVSQQYIDTLHKRYQELRTRPSLLLPFGVSLKDFDLVKRKNIVPEVINRRNGKINVVYVGVINQFFIPVIKAFFIALKESDFNMEQYQFYFIGTNYFPGTDERLVDKLAHEMNMEHLVTEIPDRIPYFSAISTLLHSDILFIPGSTDIGYNASKVYNNILSGKPILSVFYENSLVKEIVDGTNAGIFVGISENEDVPSLVKKISEIIPMFVKLHLKETPSNMDKLQKHTAKEMVRQQVEFFNGITEAKTVSGTSLAEAI